MFRFGRIIPSTILLGNNRINKISIKNDLENSF